MVFVGGWVGTWQVWLQIIELLSSERRCVAYDHRGAGQSPTHIERLTPEGMVDDVFGVLDVLSIDRCVLIGESQGGFIAAMAVLRDPSRFVGLGIVDSTPVHQPSPASDAFAALLDEDPDSPLLPFVERCVPEPGCEHIRRWLLSLLRESDPQARPALIRQMYGVDLTGRLGDIDIPTIVVHGEKDTIWPLEAGQTFANAIPTAELTVVAGAGHVPMMTRPDQTAHSLKTFLDRVAPI